MDDRTLAPRVWEEPPPWLNLSVLLGEHTVDELRRLGQEAADLEHDVEQLARRCHEALHALEVDVDGARLPEGVYELVQRLSGAERLSEALRRLVGHLSAAEGDPSGVVPAWAGATADGTE